jgi:hypothetical protein
MRTAHKTDFIFINRDEALLRTQTYLHYEKIRKFQKNHQNKFIISNETKQKSIFSEKKLIFLPMLERVLVDHSKDVV